MPDVIITYETLYELLRKEKYRTELQKLDPEFFKHVVTYLNEKEAIIASQSQKQNIFASSELEKTKTQLKNVKSILKEIYEKRESKIAQAAQFNARTDSLQDTSAMLPEEEQLYREMLETLKSYREGILFTLLNKQLPVILKQKDLKTENKTDTIQVKILQEVQEFVGPDMEVYGPYNVDEACDLPAKIADNLIINKQAQKNESS